LGSEVGTGGGEKAMWSMGARFAALMSVLLVLLSIGVGAAHTQVTATVTIDRVGVFDPHTGTATVTGTYSCGEFAGTGIIEVTLRQQVGRVATVTGSGFADVVCVPGETGTWSAEVVPTTGEFRGGQAFASVRLLFNGQAVETGRTIRLRGGGQTSS
jgi:hypothetical protein